MADWRGEKPGQVPTSERLSALVAFQSPLIVYEQSVYAEIRGRDAYDLAGDARGVPIYNRAISVP